MLTDDERGRLDRDGYVVLSDALSRPQLDVLRDAFEEVSGAGEDEEERGTRHVAGLSTDARVVQSILGKARVLTAVRHVLAREFRVLLLNGRAPRPGFGQQGLHTDWLPRQPPEPFHVVTTLWLLDAFTATNGATRVVPGSHRLPGTVPKPMRAPDGGHPEERIVTGPAGSVLVFNGHLWHSGTRNRSREPRRVLQCQFIARDTTPPTLDPLPAPAGASTELRALLGA